jgi:hypothetical protein
MKKLILPFSILLSILLSGGLLGQDRPSLTGQGAGKNPSTTLVVLFDQMDNLGAGSITSQNFEAANDIFDSFAADDFALMDMTWSILSVDVLGVYFNGPGPATSVNVWFYSSDGAGGLPVDIVYTALNVIPSVGLVDGSFSIPLPVPAVLTEGWYWLCVQANMDLTPGGQWGWTERTVQSFSESAWKNPGGGFGTICTPSWGYRVTDCMVGADPDNCFRLNGDIIPVELTSFTASINDNDVTLNWETATEINNSGFQVEKKSNGEYEAVGFIPGFGTTTEPHSYSFTDAGLQSGYYTYRLKQKDLDGTFEYSDETQVEVTIPDVFALEQNYPNPFNSSTLIRYSLPHSSSVEIFVFNTIGEVIKREVIENQEAGNYVWRFNEIDLSSGVYFYRLQAGSFVETKKMMLMK